MNSFKKYFQLVLIIIFVFVFSNVVAAQTSDFYRNLKLGDEGQDVLQLQKILNKDSETRVAVSGVGSLGNETIYFGQLTKNALIKFQNKYQKQVLAPVGLSIGTGYFGPSTINFIKNSSNPSLTNSSTVDSNNVQIIETSKSFEELLAEIVASRKKSESNKVYSNSNESTSNEDEMISFEENSEISVISQIQDSKLTTEQSKLVRSDLMEVYFVSQSVFEPGQDLTVVGTGINKDSEIYFFNFENDEVVSSVDIESNFIYFKAPSLPEGRYELYIKNDNLISKPLVVKIVDDYNPPKISSVSPSTISYGDTITIKGSNFESQNSVMTALGTYSASSNGSEIKVYIQRHANLPFDGNIVSPREQKIEGIIQVQNSQGISDAKLVDFIYN